MHIPRSVCAFVSCFSLLAVVNGAAQTFVWVCFCFFWVDAQEWNCRVTWSKSVFGPHLCGVTSLGLSPGPAVSGSCRSVGESPPFPLSLSCPIRGLANCATCLPALNEVTRTLPGDWLPGGKVGVTASCRFAGRYLHPSHHVLCSHGSESHWSGDIGCGSYFRQRETFF